MLNIGDINASSYKWFPRRTILGIVQFFAINQHTDDQDLTVVREGQFNLLQ
jgi:hypothetical protein